MKKARLETVKHWNTGVISKKTQPQKSQWAYSKQWPRTNTSCWWSDFQVFPQADPVNTEEWNYAETDHKSVYVAFSHLILCACQTVLPYFSFFMRGSCKWYISEKYWQLFEMHKGNPGCPSTTKESVYFKYMETKISSCVWNFSPRHWPFFPSYSSHIRTEITP